MTFEHEVVLHLSNRLLSPKSNKLTNFTLMKNSNLRKAITFSGLFTGLQTKEKTGYNDLHLKFFFFLVSLLMFFYVAGVFSFLR